MADRKESKPLEALTPPPPASENLEAHVSETREQQAPVIVDSMEEDVLEPARREAFELGQRKAQGVPQDRPLKVSQREIDELAALIAEDPDAPNSMDGPNYYDMVREAHAEARATIDDENAAAAAIAPYLPRGFEPRSVRLVEIVRKQQDKEVDVHVLHAAKLRKLKESGVEGISSITKDEARRLNAQGRQDIVPDALRNE